MAKGLTPIERAIAGEPEDRRRRYDERMREKGFVRLTVAVPREELTLLKAVARLLREDPVAIGQLSAIVGAVEGSERPQRSEDAPRPVSAHGRS